MGLAIGLRARPTAFYKTAIPWACVCLWPLKCDTLRMHAFSPSRLAVRLRCRWSHSLPVSLSCLLYL